MIRRLGVLVAILLVVIFAFPLVATGKRARLSGSARVVKVLESIEEKLTVSEYRHHTLVRHQKGEYYFDCSGMAAWVLRRAAPRALEVLGRPNDRRPMAVHFYRKIARIKPGKKRGPWQRVTSASAMLPGDVIAWVRPKWFNSKSTGHVAFVLSKPVKNTGSVPGVLVKIADASKFRHENDSKAEGQTGFGTGILLIPTDENDNPLGYGWIGSLTRPEWVVPTELVIGRPLR